MRPASFVRPSLFASVLTVSSFSFATAVAGDDHAQAPVDVKVYDLSDLVGSQSWTNDAVSMLPYRWSSNMPFIEFRDELEAPWESGELIDLLRSSVAPEYWDSELGALEQTGPDQLLVIASPTIQTEVERFLAFARSAHLSNAQLVVEVYEGASSLGARLQTSADARQALRNAVSEGKATHLRTGNVTLTGSRLRSIESVDYERVPFDWEVEIAQGAVIAQAVHAPIASGLTLVARPGRVDGGTTLDLLLRQADEVGRTTRDLNGYGTINNKETLRQVQATGLVDHPHMSFCSFSGSVTIPDGKTLWIPVSTAVFGSTVDYLISIRVDGTPKPYRSRFDYSTMTYDPDTDEEQQTAFSMVVQDVSSLISRGVRPAPISNLLFDLANNDWDDSEQLMTGIMETEDVPVMEMDALMELITRTVRPDTWDSNANYVINQFNTTLQYSTDTDVADEVAERIASLHQTESYLIEGRLTLADGRESLFACPIDLGLPSALWSGVQRTAITGWDVDVANESSIPNVEVGALVDGYAMSFTLTRSGQQLLLGVQAKANLLREAPKDVSYEVSDGRFYTDARTRTLTIDDRRFTAPGTPMTWGGDALSLELTVKPMPGNLP